MVPEDYIALLLVVGGLLLYRLWPNVGEPKEDFETKQRHGDRAARFDPNEFA